MFSHSLPLVTEDGRAADGRDRRIRLPNNENAATLPRTITVTTVATRSAPTRNGVCHITRRVIRSIGLRNEGSEEVSRGIV